MKAKVELRCRVNPLVCTVRPNLARVASRSIGDPCRLSDYIP